MSKGASYTQLYVFVLANCTITILVARSYQRRVRLVLCTLAGDSEDKTNGILHKYTPTKPSPILACKRFILWQMHLCQLGSPEFGQFRALLAQRARLLSLIHPFVFRKLTTEFGLDYTHACSPHLSRSSEFGSFRTL